MISESNVIYNFGIYSFNSIAFNILVIHVIVDNYAWVQMIVICL